jgi:ATP-dependent DNA ligase
MLAQACDELPQGEPLRYEPKWDGFRAVVFRDGADVRLMSRSGQPLQRYFPEVVAALQAALPPACVLDGEIILPGPKGLDFEALQARLHPAASRIARLSAATPASFVAFDCLAVGEVDLRERPNAERRAQLLAAFTPSPQVFVTPSTKDPVEARRWFQEFEGAGCDGLMIRDDRLGYQPEKRVMWKLKPSRTAECVVGGFRVGKTAGSVGSLLLGLYDEAGVLHHVGHTSSFTAKQKRELFAQFSALAAEASFTGRAPDAPSRWAKERDTSWTPVTPTTVVEVKYDALLGPRFRHATTFLRWRADREPASCRSAQLEPVKPFSLDALLTLAREAR